MAVQNSGSPSETSQDSKERPCKAKSPGSILENKAQEQIESLPTNLEELLNPAIENKNMFNATDEDIFESMMHAKALGDGGGSANGDDDNDNACR